MTFEPLRLLLNNQIGPTVPKMFMHQASKKGWFGEFNA